MSEYVQNYQNLSTYFRNIKRMKKIELTSWMILFSKKTWSNKTYLYIFLCFYQIFINIFFWIKYFRMLTCSRKWFKRQTNPFLPSWQILQSHLVNPPWWVEKLFFFRQIKTVADRILLFGGILKLGSQKRPKWVIYLNKLEHVQAIKTEQNV